MSAARLGPWWQNLDKVYVSHPIVFKRKGLRGKTQRFGPALVVSYGFWQVGKVS
jgi:hypothetical protein